MLYWRAFETYKKQRDSLPLLCPLSHHSIPLKKAALFSRSLSL